MVKAVSYTHLTHQTVTQVAGSYVFTFFTGQRAVVYDEVNGKSRLGDFLERGGNRVLQIAAESISDVDSRDTGILYCVFCKCIKSRISVQDSIAIASETTS